MIDIPFNPRTLEYFLLAVSLLTIISVLSSKASSFFGVPTLLLFLGIGMLAGSEGPGGIYFSNYSLTFMIGSISLVFILFDGGLKTPLAKVRPILRIGVLFSTLAVTFTCFMVGAFGHYALGLAWKESLLLGAIVSSTDAAAVFSILRSKRLALKGQIKQVLEFEAGSNDPMAIILTLAFLQILMGSEAGPSEIGKIFILQGSLGLVLGWAGGRVTLWLMNNVKVDYDGLYSVLLVAMVVFIFSITSFLGGSGFLAVYLAGIIIGNGNLLRKQSLLLFNDGIAWICQISLFLVLGLLVYPTHLSTVWKEGTVLALFMMVIARPVSVLLCSLGAGFSTKEKFFISWVGLRGAAPIILAILPWSAQYEKSDYYFNLVFFVVLFSVALQGPSIPWLAKKLRLTEESEDERHGQLAVLPRGFISLEIMVSEESEGNGKRILDIGLPSGILLISIERSDRYIIPQGDTELRHGDRIIALARPSSKSQLEDLFGNARYLS